MVVDAVCCELVSAAFPVKQGICREFEEFGRSKLAIPSSNWRTSAGIAKNFRRNNREFSSPYQGTKIPYQAKPRTQLLS